MSYTSVRLRSLTLYYRASEKMLEMKKVQETAGLSS